MNIFFCQVLRFFTNQHKPMILALSRPDPKKNVTTLLKAYGESRQLRELANLVLFQATI
jgi:sucrose-phosphate synthase